MHTTLEEIPIDYVNDSNLVRTANTADSSVGPVHAGVSCDQCGMMPIVGRWFALFTLLLVCFKPLDADAVSLSLHYFLLVTVQGGVTK